MDTTWFRSSKVGDPGSEAGVWTTAVIVVTHSRRVDRRCASLIGISQSSHSRRSVPINRSQNALAFGVRTSVLSTCRPHRRDRPVESRRVNAIPIVENEPVERLRGDGRAQLLDRPLRRRMVRHVPVEDLTRADVEDDENMEDAEAHRHGRGEITGDDRVCMIPHKRRPPLGALPAVPGPQGPKIPCDRLG